LGLAFNQDPIDLGLTVMLDLKALGLVGSSGHARPNGLGTGSQARSTRREWL